MNNVYELQKAQITKVIEENPTTKTLHCELKAQKSFQFLAGQFMMVGLPGFGECPISISSNPKDSKKYFSLTIRAVGELTEQLINLKKGDTVWVRGPFGNGFPEITGNLILVGGGCGYIPLRSIYEEQKIKKSKNQESKMQIFLGCSDESTLVFKRDYKQMKQKHDFNLIMEKGRLVGFTRGNGYVTDLIKKKKLLPNAPVFVCGPEVMYKFVVKELLAKGIKAEDIYVSLERRMHCGVGICQHCAIGEKYVCKDGPVFSYSYLETHKYF